jgi:short-subunit dehydrogenase
MRRQLEGRVALITGASAGIGEATAEAFARRGCSLILAARRVDLLTRLAERLNSGRESVPCLPVHLDVTDLGSIQQAVENGLRRFGKVDVLVNNAGIGRLDWLDQMDPAEGIERQIRVNLIGLAEVTRAVLPSMLGQRWGHIINVASIAALIGTPTYSLYAASKFGVRGFSEALRREVASSGVRVSVIYPGPVRTGFAGDAVVHRKTAITAPGWLVLTPKGVGEAIAGLVTRPRRTLVLPRVMQPLIWANVVAPGLIDWVVTQAFVRRERGEAPGTSPHDS